MNATTFSPETMGRIYETEHYVVHSRRIGGDGQWFGASRFKTIAEAAESIRTASHNACGLASFNGGQRERFEYRIVHVKSICEVMDTCVRLV